jgi:hypothetical protein
MVRPVRIALHGEQITQQAPGIRGLRFQAQHTPQRRNRIAQATSLAVCNGQFQVHRGRLRLLEAERLQYLEGGQRPTGNAMRGPKDETCPGVSGDGFQDLVRLLGGQTSVLLEEPGGVSQRDIKCSNGVGSIRQFDTLRAPSSTRLDAAM